MNTGGRQLLQGLLAVLLSLAIVTGSLLLSMVEGGMVSVLPLSQPASPTPILLTPSLTVAPKVTLDQKVELPFSFTATPTLTIVSTITHTPIPPTNCPPPAGWLPIQTAPGDSLEYLAGNYGTTIEALMQANCLLISQILPGTQLYVPPFKSPTPAERCGPPSGWIQYTVQFGDTLYRLSLMFNVKVYELQVANCLTSTRILVGQRLYVPNLPTWTPIVVTLTPTRTSTPTMKIVTPPTPIPSSTMTSIPTATMTQIPSATALPTIAGTVTLDPTETPVPTETPKTPDSSGGYRAEQITYP